MVTRAGHCYDIKWKWASCYRPGCLEAQWSMATRTGPCYAIKLKWSFYLQAWLCGAGWSLAFWAGHCYDIKWKWPFCFRPGYAGAGWSMCLAPTWPTWSSREAAATGTSGQLLSKWTTGEWQKFGWTTTRSISILSGRTLTLYHSMTQ